MIDGVKITPLKRIFNEKGDIFHALKGSEESFSSFGEAYFSSVNKGDIKGWKKHSVMVLNLIVPVGQIRFVIYDERQGSATFGEFFDIVIGPENYSRLTVPSGLWMSFQGVGGNQNLLLNIASIEHDPTEATNRNLAEINFDW